MELKDFLNDKEYDVIVTVITNKNSSEMFFYDLIKNPLNYNKPNESNGGNKAIVIILV